MARKSRRNKSTEVNISQDIVKNKNSVRYSNICSFVC